MGDADPLHDERVAAQARPCRRSVGRLLCAALRRGRGALAERRPSPRLRLRDPPHVSARSCRRSRGSTTTRRSTRSPPSKTVGRVSGFGWGMGYLGGHHRPAPAVLPAHPARRRAVRGHGHRRHGHPGVDGHLRAVDPALHDPRVPRAQGPPPSAGPRVGVAMSYRLVGRSITGLWSTSRHTVVLPPRLGALPRRAGRRVRLRRHPRLRDVRALGRRRHRLRGRRQHRGRGRDDGLRPARRPDRAEEGHPRLAGVARRARHPDLHPPRRRARRRSGCSACS